jgi:hypothetical protein
MIRTIPHIIRSSALGVALLLAAAVPSWAVDVKMLNPSTGYEPPNGTTNAVPATLTLSRTSGSGALQVRVMLNSASSATLTTDYTVTGFDAAFAVDADGDLSTTATFPSGVQTLAIVVTPVDDSVVEARESVRFELKTTLSGVSLGYNAGAPSALNLTIADNDHKARIQIPNAIADEDSALFGLVNDPDVQRRAVMRVRFDQFTALTFDRNLPVDFRATGGTQPIATLDTDYEVTYKICGNNNVGTTSEASRIGYDKVNARGTGLGYTMIAYLAGATSIAISGATSDDDALPSGSTIQFANHGTTYTIASAGASGIVLTSGLTSNLPNNTEIIVLSLGGGTTDPPVNLKVSRTYPAGSTNINVDFGSGGLYEGDVFQLPGDSSFYVVTADTVSLTSGFMSSGQLSFRRYQGGGVGGGLAVATGGSPELVTHIAPTIVSTSSGAFLSVLVPDESTKVEISIAPTLNGDGAEGVEEVRMRLVADSDYELLTPQEASIYIADRDVTTSVSLESNAGLPSQAGYFKVKFSGPFSRSISVPYIVTDNVSGAYTATLGSSVSLTAGQTEALILVDPIIAAGEAAVTLTLNGGLDYKLAGSTSSGVNPSATMDISNSVGAVTIVATDATAAESATVSATSLGAFTVSIVRNSGQNGSVGINLAVSGTAVNGSRYEFYNADVGSGNGIYTVTNNQIQVVIPGLPGTLQNSTIVGVRALNNFVADNNQVVNLTVAAGQSYTVGATANAAVTIVDDEPTVSVQAIGTAARPSTPAAFVFSYPGASVGQAINVQFTYGGTGVLNTDFIGDTTITIPAGNTSATLPITPIDTSEGSAETVSVTITAPAVSPTYNVGTATATLDILASDAPSDDKPTPGTVNSGESSGGCGLGSGLAAFLAFGLFALFATLRRRQP